MRSDTRDLPKPDSEGQLQTFELATRLFHDQRFAEAKIIFQKATIGPHQGIAHNARLHMMMCDRRLEKEPLLLETAEEHYDYAVERMNARDLENACKHLNLAMTMVDWKNDRADHLFYALAICRGVSGDLNGAYENLKRAIEIDPKNLVAARQDSDFAAMANQPLLRQLLYPEKD